MSARHTPGPWIAVGRWVEHPRDDIPDICTTDPAALDQDGRSDAECCANARLIAAAPELLTALREIVASADRGQAFFSTFLLLDARAAIAKATGGRL